MLSHNIDRLVEYGLKSGLISEDERIYTTNLLLEVFNERDYEPTEVKDDEIELEDILKELLDEAVKRNIIEDSVTYRDLFDTKIMNCLMPRPSQVRKTFWEKYSESPKASTDYFYKLSQDSNYIRRYRVRKDLKWKVSSEYGDIDITINLSKPEKDPKAIAAAKNVASSSYPKCLLCMENEGYAGGLNHPARHNHRIIPVKIDEHDWGFQYSPYVYYNEHCIVFNGEHVPMKISRGSFERLFNFVKMFPHYFIGSNADLPIVGGSILSHDHFQGGCYEFAMAKAPIEKEISIKGYDDIKAGIVKWPMSVIRLKAKDTKRITDLAEHILNVWRGYTDEDAFIFAETDGEPHNTITPIARMRDDEYELDLVLRNNITTKEHPLGVYHPHSERHHIKKENIGLIEVMGLAVLPSRLKNEMAVLKECILEGKPVKENETVAKHAAWVDSFTKEYKEAGKPINKDTIDDVINTEVGKEFVRVLEDSGVYKCTPQGREAFMRFINSL